MSKANMDYFTDSLFQLELNLHNIRRELILMIEEFEQQDCMICLELKCRCPSKVAQNQNDSGRTSRTSPIDQNFFIHNTMDIAKRVPLADTLSKHTFEIEEIIENPGASKPERQLNREIEVWLKKSKISQSATSTQNEENIIVSGILSGTLKKAWSNGRPYDPNTEETLARDEREKVVIDPRYANTAIAVEAFFKNFKVQQINMTPANLAYIKNKLTAVYIQQNAKKTEYTYF